MRKSPLTRQCADLVLPVLLPVPHIVRLSDLERTSGVDERADGVVKPCRDDQLLVAFRCARLDGGDKSRSNPDTTATVPETCTSVFAIANGGGVGVEMTLRATKMTEHKRGVLTYERDAAKPRPSAMPPAATTKTGFP